MGTYTGTNGADTIVPGTVSAGVTVVGAPTPSGVADTLTGNGGADTLGGGGGGDTFNLGEDLYILGPNQRSIPLNSSFTLLTEVNDVAATLDEVNGGAGFDRILFDRGSRSGFIADYYDASNPNLIRNVELFRGTDGADYITMHDIYTNGATIEGLAGDDVVVGSNNRNDTVRGGTGNDVVGGRGGNDRLQGDAGTDEVWGGDGNDTITLGRDGTYSGPAPFDAGVSVTNAAHTFDTVHGGDGIDTIVLAREGASGYINDYTGAGFLVDGVEHWVGTSGRDVIVLPEIYTSAEGDAVKIEGLSGNDILVGSDDTLDDILGGNGDDFVDGRAGNDDLSGGAGGDKILGGAGEDTLNGGAGDDELDGGAGSDVLIGGVGIDSLEGGSEDDIFDFNSIAESPASDPDLIASFEGIGAAGGDRIDVRGIDAIAGGSDQNFIFNGTTAGGAGRLWVVDGPGTDTLVLANVNGSAAPELAIIVADGAAVAADWDFTGDFIL